MEEGEVVMVMVMVRSGPATTQDLTRRRKQSEIMDESANFGL
jgi:hypothetical protein